MSAGRKGSTTGAGVRSSSKPGGTGDAVRKWVQEDTREEGKAVFKQHIKETSNLDVLSRCKKLNELLSSDVLKGKGDSKEQLKEILGILHAGPKRPSFLDKPSITASAGKKATAAAAGPPPPNQATFDPDALLRFIKDEEVLHADRPTQPQPSNPSPQGPAEDVDDLISLLNDAPPPSTSTQPPAAAARAQAKQEAEEAERQRTSAQEADRERKAKAEQEKAERQRKAKAEQEEVDRKRAEAQRLERLRRGAALCIQSQWRGLCARRLAARRRKQLAEQRVAAAAATVLQAAWRARRVAKEHRARLAAARALQCAARAWQARRRLQRLQVQEFVRQRSARLIQRAFRFFLSRGYTLGPLRLPPQGGPRPNSGAGVDGAALLSKALRLRSAVDARLAPEVMQQTSGESSHRTVVTHRERVRQVSANERTRRADMGERATMAGSSHRDEAEAMSIARQGQGGSGPAPAGPAPSSPAPGMPPPTPRTASALEGGRPLSRTGSSSGRPPTALSSGGSGDAAGRPRTALSSGGSGDAAGLVPGSGLRPVSSLRRLSGSAMIGIRPASPGLPPSR